MDIASIGIPSGVNAQKVTAFIGAKLHEMTGYDFDASLKNHFMDEMKQLTSPFPIVGGLSSAISAAVEVGSDIGSAMQRATQNSGPQNAR